MEISTLSDSKICASVVTDWQIAGSMYHKNSRAARRFCISNDFRNSLREFYGKWSVQLQCKVARFETDLKPLLSASWWTKVSSVLLLAFSDSLCNLNIKLPFRNFFSPLVASVRTNLEHMYVHFLCVPLARLLCRVLSPRQCEYAWCVHAYVLTDHVCLEITHSSLSASCFMYSAISFHALTDGPVHGIFLSCGLLKTSRFF